MAVTVEASGTQAATLDTEHTLHGSDTDDKVFQLAVDLNAMVDGDVTILRIYATLLSGGTERLAFQATYPNAQVNKIVYSIPIAATEGWKATLEQTDGAAGRSYPWIVYSV